MAKQDLPTGPEMTMPSGWRPEVNFGWMLTSADFIENIERVAYGPRWMYDTIIQFDNHFRPQAPGFRAFSQPMPGKGPTFRPHIRAWSSDLPWQGMYSARWTRYSGIL